MDMMEIRRRILMMPHVRTIGGLPVLIDNARLMQYNGTINERIATDADYFVTGWFDTGSTASKSYTITNIYAPGGGYVYMRPYNDKDGTSVDYWDIGRSGATRTVTTAGRFIVTTVYKATAANFYIYDNTNNRYVCKGKNVR